MIRLIPRRQLLCLLVLPLALAGSGWCQGKGTLSAVPSYLPLDGGSVHFTVDRAAPAQGIAYFILGTASGTVPGMKLGGVSVPLNPDRFMDAFIQLTLANQFPGSWGILDPQGRSTANLTVPPFVVPAMSGMTLHFSAVFMDIPTAGYVAATPPAEVGLARRRVHSQTFTTMTGLDPLGTGITVGSSGATPGKLGGNGIMGSFELDMFENAKPVGKVLTLDTDYTVISAKYTLTGYQITVKDGVFRFSDFIVPKGYTLKFTGSRIPRIYVAGAIDIYGQVLVDGIDAVAHDGSSPVSGPGAPGHCGGGSGGNGALRGGNGLTGGTVGFPPGSPWYMHATTLGTPGGGASNFPGTTAAITYNGYDGWVCAQCAAGGAGGGNWTSGKQGSVALSGSDPRIIQYRLTDVPAPSIPGGFFPYAAVSTNSVADFLAGGAGGGGGGSCTLGSMKGYSITWSTGQGGGSGGGALLLRSGGTLTVRGTLSANGGFSPRPVAYKRAMPGGGGSGGNILMQAGQTVHFQGTVVAEGGGGGVYTELASYNWTTSSYGGSGGYGYLRVETDPAPSLASLVGFRPAATTANLGRLQDRDAVTSARSDYVYLGADTFLHRFTIKTKENGQPVVYSCHPQAGKLPQQGVTPVAIFLQGAKRAGTSGVQAGSQTRWVQNPADLYNPNNWAAPSLRPDMVRYILVLDTRQLASPATLAVEGLKLESYR